MNWKIQPNADTQDNPFMQKLKAIKTQEIDGVTITAKPGMGPNMVALVVVRNKKTTRIIR